MPRIHAYFENMYEARKAFKAMQEAGFTKVYLDMSGAYDYEYSVEISCNSKDVSCLPPLVTKSGGSLLSPDNPALVTAGTSVSGLSHADDPGLVCTKLVANTDDEKKEAAQDIIKENGGRILPTFIE